MDKNIGKKLDGRYEITELIGVGGMADVYKGVDVIDNKQVAVKILKKEFAENEEFLRRFRNESKAIAVLSHPNIVKIYDVGFSEKIQYIVMEYIDGITLKEYIEEEKVLTWKDTVHFVIQILRALEHAHEKGIVHRDIKPQNIMMFTDGTIKVMDFGIAKFAREEGKTATDQAIGTVHYISPEQAKGDVTDEKSDIYSIGAMMYEMLAGRKPFDSDNPVSIAVMHMHDTPERPKAVNPEIPEGLEEIVLKAMEKNPEDRYQTTTEMIADIEAFKNNPEIVFGYYQEENPDNTKFFGAVADGEETLPEGEETASQNALYEDGYASNLPQPQDENYVDYDDEEDDDDEEEDERPSLVVPVLTAAVVVVIIVAVIFVASLLSGLLKGDNKKADFKMPNLVGMDYNDAVAKWGDSFQIKENGYVYNEADSGTITEQDIAPGTEFRKGDVVKVKISKGMEKVTIPTNLTNMNVELAKAQLTEIGLKCEIKNTSSTEIDKGNVIESEPAGGTEVDIDSVVILYVSMGIDSEQVIVETYIGKTIEDCASIASYQGLIIEQVPEPSYEDEGIVFEQSLEPGAVVETGSTIVLKVSSGVLPEGEIPFTIYFPQEAYGRFVVDFLITNEDGSADSIDSSTFMPQEMADKSITTSIKGKGSKANVIVVLTNKNNNLSYRIGEYSVDFETSSIRALYEDVNLAFVNVDGFYVEPTTVPTEPPTEPPTPELTQAPTQPPTQAPTPPPTQPSTPEPTQPPTQAPTEAPTPEPTEAPTEEAEAA